MPVIVTASIPRRLHLMIPALALVERDCWRTRPEPQTAVKCFILTLGQEFYLDLAERFLNRT